MHTTAAQYCEFAEECEQLARETPNQRHSGALKEMADAWRKLAAQADSMQPQASVTAR